VRNGAHISPCGKYRYNLWRSWFSANVIEPEAGTVLFVMLNPSTADASEDDATIRKCIGFAKKWGQGGITVVNVFGLRATDPAELFKADDPVGPDNDRAIREAAKSHELVVAAWGTNAAKVSRARVQRVRNMLGRRLLCLKKSKDGHPWHPLYVPYSKALEPFDDVDFPRETKTDEKSK